MGVEPGDVEAIFNAALEKSSAEERAAYLDGACGSDADLRARVEVLLQAHDEAGSFLIEPAVDPDASTADSAMPREEPGTIIGQYKLLQLIGEGGFGLVYMAEQQKPIYRKVALKIIKLGMDTKQVIARFEAERQALALMDHPNIATVLDAGATETGRPYFVMELVKGVPITEHCDTNGLSTKERLGLFLSLCDAVQHAHQKGIIHRDIKPSNVMVTLHDGKPVPKVIDFGIAKATHQRLTEKTLFTEFHQFVGTPEYMSPEQAEMSGLDVDTRSDIYSLGVLLYELLVGTTPFDPKALRQAAYAEIQRIIREEEPPKPSTRFSSLGDASTAIAKNHQSDPRSLERELRGDLDWITMRCLQKDRVQRYTGAAELAADIRRHLSHEPVVAGPPTVAYRFHKFVRRNRRLVASVAAVFVVLVAAVVVSTSFAIQATRARDEAEHQATIATEAKREAERQTAIAQEVNDFLNNDLLASVDPASAQGREITVREVLDKASETIEDRLEDDPLVEASIRSTLGATYVSLGEYEQAQPHLQRALTLRQTELDEAHPRVLQSVNDLASVYQRQGRYDEAEPMFGQALELSRRVLGEEHPDTLMYMSNVAVLYAKQGRYDEAEPLYVRSLELSRRVLGEEHPDTLMCMNNLASLYQRLHQFEKAEPLFVQTIELCRRVLGEEHPGTLLSISNLAKQYTAQGRYDEAEPLCVQTLELRRRVLGEEHPKTLISMSKLAELYERQGRYVKAEELGTAALAGARSSLPEGHWHIGAHLGNYGQLAVKLKRHGDAEAALLESYEILETAFGAAHHTTIETIRSLVKLYEAWGKPDQAAEWRQRLPAPDPSETEDSPSPDPSSEAND